jgi:hypothetical protein
METTVTEINSEDFRAIAPANAFPSCCSRPSDGQTIETLLAHFLAESAAHRFRLGEFDCGLFLADWCKVRLGVDPARELRAKYSTVEEAKRIMATGMLPIVFSRLLRRAGIPLTKTPMFGDVAMVHMNNGGARGAIVGMRGYITLAQGMGITRISFTRARRIAAWAL